MSQRPGSFRRALIPTGAALLLLTWGAAAFAEMPPVPRPRPAEPGAADFQNGRSPAPLLPVEETAGEPRLPRVRPVLGAAAASAPAQTPPAAIGPEIKAPAVPPGQLTSIAGELLSPTLPVAAAAIKDLLPPPAKGASGPASAVAAIDLLARTPRSRPSGPPSAALALINPAERTGTDLGQQAPIAPPAPAVLSSSDDACMKRLGELGVQFARMPPIDPGGACPVAAPLKVDSFGSGVAVAPGATMNCRTAEAVALWVRDVLVPQSKAHLGAVPTHIVPGSTYACRGLNNQPGAKLSEHAQANAFDVMAIAFADRPPLEIAPRGTAYPEGRFQAQIRQKSCAYFTTVLGPGSDASHANHLHFDLAERRGDYRLCSLGETRIAGRRNGAAKPEQPK